MSSAVELEMKRKAEMAKKLKSGQIGLGGIGKGAIPVSFSASEAPIGVKGAGMGDLTLNASSGSSAAYEGAASSVGQGVQSVMPGGSYINPQTAQFSQSPPPAPAPAPVASNYTIYIIVAGVLVALYFYQKSKGRQIFDLSGLARDFTNRDDEQ